jgi:hypothetical protein
MKYALPSARVLLRQPEPLTPIEARHLKLTRERMAQEDELRRAKMALGYGNRDLDDATEAVGKRRQDLGFARRFLHDHTNQFRDPELRGLERMRRGAAIGVNQNIKGEDSPKVLARKDAVRDAGPSPDQAKTAIRVNLILIMCR